VKKTFSNNRILVLVLSVYVLVNLFYLDSYPFVHSDEAWLASLSRTMIKEVNPAATEEFFKITERYPHALKILFHFLQIPFLSFTFSIYSARLLSVIAAAISLFFIYRLIIINGFSCFPAFVILLIIGADIQHIYISRFARQEVLIYLSSVIQLYLVSAAAGKNNPRYIFYAGIVSGLSIFIHPNSFIIFCGIIPYLFLIITIGNFSRKQIFKAAGSYIALNAVFAAAVVIISLIMNSSFFENYYSFGFQHGVADSFMIKILSFPRFIYKIFYQIQGTYYLPDVRMQLLLFFLSLIMVPVIILSVKSSWKKLLPPVFYICGITSGIIIIGKYSPPSVFFLFMPFWLLTAVEFDIFRKLFTHKIKIYAGIKTAGYIAVFVIIASQTAVLFKEAGKWNKISYTDYGNKITEYTGSRVISGNILANTNTAFFFDYGKLCSYSDLESINQTGITFSDYIKINKIEYIIWNEELDIISKERPVWNDLYGNVYNYYSEAIEFLNNKCTLEKTIKDRVYTVRIADYMLKRDYEARIFRVNN